MELLLLALLNYDPSAITSPKPNTQHNISLQFHLHGAPVSLRLRVRAGEHGRRAAGVVAVAGAAGRARPL